MSLVFVIESYIIVLLCCIAIAAGHLRKALRSLLTIVLKEYSHDMCAGLTQKSLAGHPHNSRPSPASAAALLRHEDAATSAAGTLDAGCWGSAQRRGLGGSLRW